MSKQTLMEKIDKLPPERLADVEQFVDALDQSEGQRRALELERRLFEAGLLSEIKPPITDFTPYANRKPIENTGKPLSEIIIEERR
jgi:hypothetical protein